MTGSGILRARFGPSPYASPREGRGEENRNFLLEQTCVHNLPAPTILSMCQANAVVGRFAGAVSRYAARESSRAAADVAVLSRRICGFLKRTKLA